MMHSLIRAAGRGYRVARDAETIALQAMTWLLADDDRLLRFLALTGADLADIRARASSRPVLVGVMDHIMSDETLLVAFAGNEGLRPEVVAEAAHRLGGAH